LNRDAIDANLDRALEICKKDAERTTAEVLLAAAGRGLRAGDVKTARDYLQQVVERFPEDFRGCEALARLERGQVEGLNRAIEIQQQGNRNLKQANYQVIVSLAYDLARAGRNREAEGELEKLDAILPFVSGTVRGLLQLQAADRDARIRTLRGFVLVLVREQFGIVALNLCRNPPTGLRLTPSEGAKALCAVSSRSRCLTNSCKRQTSSCF
jgi:tetratricopeptide (TPR) repeat protein